MEALATANERRLGRARTKREIAAGELSIAEALSRDCCISMLVSDLLEAQWKWGPHKARKALWRAELNPYVSVGNLTERQRSALVAAL
jgi:hypothetical protein